MRGGVSAASRPSRARIALVAATIAAGCASPGLPPGGPPDPNPPKIVRITPDTGKVSVRVPRVVFQFDEVVSERPQGAVNLAGLFLVSPRQGEPEVDWHRDAITVRPRRGFRANTVYTVTMLPGLVDLRGNVRKEGAQTVFSTGPTIPRSRITGIVFDWAAGRVAAAPLVEAIQRPDSVVYVTVADSAGRFTFPYLAPGSYTVRAVLDANNNRALDPRESWDSVAVALRDSGAVELLAFVHDSTGPGIRDVTLADSVTLRVALDRPIDPALRLAPALFVLRAADSTTVAVTSVASASVFDSLRATETPTAGAPAPPRQGARPAPRPPAFPPPAPPTAQSSARDTIPRDSSRAAAATGPRPSRPIPPSEVVLRTARPLAAGASYRLSSPGLRGLLGTSRESSRVFTTPKAAPSDSVRADSARATPRADSSRAPRGTAPRNPR